MADIKPQETKLNNCVIFSSERIVKKKTIRIC